ncbi:crossover junction endodeoxyribonuclease RuvC [Patescibacteria group bacterium]|nr:crossover junction endodeoxyribonuclease RuvC [Patescibacteria group bacterium]
MIILGIDPGTTRIGYGLIEKDAGIHLLRCGLISGEGVAPEEQLVLLEKELVSLINKTTPDLMCVEKLFFSKNKKTAFAVAEARGVIIMSARKLGIKVLEFAPNEIKSIVAGDGRADKKGVERAVCMTLGTDSIPGPDDVSDALAVALCGAFSRNTEGA